MRRRDLDYIVILAMVISGLYVAVTGLLADLFGLHQVAFHSYAGYLWAGLAVLHVALNFHRTVAYVQRLGRRLQGPPECESEPARQQVGGAVVGRRRLIWTALAAAGGFLVGRFLPRRRDGLPEEAADIGALYHRWSAPGSALDLLLPDWGGRPPRYKSYPDAERIVLPDPRGWRGLTVEEALQTRRSVRDYDGESIALVDLSRLLHAAQGITDEGLEFRAAPSAGALYPIDLYPVVHRVVDLASGVYHYGVKAHDLERLREGDFRGDVTAAGLHQGFLGRSAVTFLLSGVFQRTRWKYRERAYRYILLEAGHIAQNLYLAATSMGLGACAVGAFYDRQCNELLGLDGEEEASLYVITVGGRA